jgi:hypothetical protein
MTNPSPQRSSAIYNSGLVTQPSYQPQVLVVDSSTLITLAKADVLEAYGTVTYFGQITVSIDVLADR